MERYFPGFKAFVDATEQEIPRPKNVTKRKTHYSGKRKRHTVKTQLTVNSKGLAVWVGSYVFVRFLSGVVVAVDPASAVSSSTLA